MPALPKPERIEAALQALQAHMELNEFNNLYIEPETDDDVIKAIIGSNSVTGELLALIAEERHDSHFHASNDVLRAIVARPGIDDEYDDVLDIVAKNPNADIPMLEKILELTSNGLKIPSFSTLMAVSQNKNIDQTICAKIMAGFILYAQSGEMHAIIQPIFRVLRDHLANADIASQQVSELFLTMAKALTERAERNNGNERMVMWAKETLLAIARHPRATSEVLTEIVMGAYKNWIEDVEFAIVKDDILKAAANHQNATSEILTEIISTRKDLLDEEMFTAIAKNPNATAEVLTEIMLNAPQDWFNDEILAAIANNPHVIDNSMLKVIIDNPQANTETFEAITNKTKNSDVINAIMINKHATAKTFMDIVGHATPESIFTQGLEDTSANYIEDLEVLLAVAKSPKSNLRIMEQILFAAKLAYARIPITETSNNSIAKEKTIAIFNAIVEHTSITKAYMNQVDKHRVGDILADIAGRFIVGSAPNILKAIVKNTNADASALKRVALQVSGKIEGNTKDKSLLMEIAEDDRSQDATLAAVAYMAKDSNTLAAVSKNPNAGVKVQDYLEKPQLYHQGFTK